MSDAARVGEPFNPWKQFVGAFLPNCLMERTDLSPGAKLAYGRLCQHAGQDGLAFPSTATLGREIGVKERRARELIAELEAAKLIERRPIPGKTNRFVFLWQEWMQTPRQDPAAPTPAGSCRPPRQDPAGEETQVRDSPPEAAPLGEAHQARSGSLFAEPDQETYHASKNRPRRGTRLDPDWCPPAEAWAFGRTLGFSDAEIAEQLERFRDHWIAKAGRDACKLDWPATFRNWLRRAPDYGRGPGAARGGYARSPRGSPASVVASVNRIRD